MTPYDSDEVLMIKLITGKADYDVVFAGTAFAAVMAKARVFQKLDPAAVPNRDEIDPGIMKTLMPNDPNMDYFVPYTTAVTAFAYNADKLGNRLPSRPRPCGPLRIRKARISAQSPGCGRRSRRVSEKGTTGEEIL